MTKWFVRMAGVATLATMIGVACTSDAGNEGKEGSSATSTEAQAATPTTDSGAAELRAGLTSLLQEHVYLSGFAVNAAVSGGDFDAAAGALDENSVQLSDAIASVYGEEAGGSFLELWRKHIGMVVDYTQGKAGDDQAKVDKAVSDLDQYRQDFGAFLASANPNLTQEAVAEELVPHIQSLAAAVDAAVAGDPSVYEKLKEAASHMPMTANVLAGAIVKQFPEKFS